MGVVVVVLLIGHCTAVANDWGVVSEETINNENLIK